MSYKLQMTYIPARYWNVNLSNFKLLSKNKSLPKDANFFLLWNDNDTDKALNDQIKHVFSDIPAEKLLSCEINLAFPMDKNYFKIAPIQGKILPISPIIKILYQINIYERHHLSSSIKTWSFLTKFIFELLNRGSFIPILEERNEKLYTGNWRLVLKRNDDHERFKAILNGSPWQAFNLPINFIGTLEELKASGLWHPSYVFLDYMDSVGDFLIRSTLKKIKFSTFNDFYSSEIKKEKIFKSELSWDYRFLKTLIEKENQFTIEKFHDTIIPTLINDWVQQSLGLTIKQDFSLTLELKYPKPTENEWLLKFYARSLKNSKKILLKDLWDSNSIEVILRSLRAASRIFPPITSALNHPIPQEVKLNISEVMDFLKYPKDLLIQNGFNVILPEGFAAGGKHRLSTRLVIRSRDKKNKGISTALPSMFDVNSMLEFKWVSELEGEKLTDKEFKDLISNDAPLINWRGQWILVDQNEVKELSQVIQKSSESVNYMEALRIGLAGSIKLGENGTKYEVIIEGEFSDILERLQSIETFDKILCPSSFNGKLRPYQETGLTWMGNMCAYNFGLCLADDMGLGKTIQIIAFLLYQRDNYKDHSGSIIIICPTSVLFNWSREIQKFAPELEIMYHHGPKRVKDISEIKKLSKQNLIILTTYGTIRNDIDLLKHVPFKGVIVDEIQNTKNYSSKQTQAIVKLQSQFRIGLSGTPIENRLMELWTLFEFLNPGLLESRTDFQTKYVIPIERFQDQEAIKRLKMIISPFILRRVKADKTIIADLPDKNEMKIFVELSDVQANLYKSQVEETLKEIESSGDNRKKKGLVLGLLVKLKQICNHPHHYLKQKEIGKNLTEFISQSQKVERLIEMTDEIIENNEKILIFTQFKQMGDLIKKALELKYEIPILFFHGSVPEKKRREIVDAFQSEDINSNPILLLSLKAGGTGLNLTRGTTVIHFDRWWNPAVEDQATDRAYRIGQKSTVNVYKFISIGTIEEKIDVLLEEKRDLADKILTSSGESWISDVTYEKLKELLQLNV